MIIIMIIITTKIANVRRRKVYVYQKANGKAPSKARTNIEHHSIRTQYNRLKSIHLEMIKKDIKSAPQRKRNDGVKKPTIPSFGSEQHPSNIFAFQHGIIRIGGLLFSSKRPQNILKMSFEGFLVILSIGN